MTQKKSIEDYILPLDEAIKEAAPLIDIGIKTQMAEMSFTMDVAVSLLAYAVKYQKILKENQEKKIDE